MRSAELINLKKLLPFIPKLWNDPLNGINSMIKKYGNVLRFNVAGYDEILLVNDPVVIKYILKDNKDNYIRGKAIGALRGLLGDGILIANEDNWKFQHDLLKASFNEKAVLDYSLTVSESKHELVSQYSKFAELEESFDLGFHSKIFFLDMMIKMMFHSKASFDYKYIIEALENLTDEASIKNQIINFPIIKFRRLFNKNYQLWSKSGEDIKRLRAMAIELIQLAENDPQNTKLFLKNLLDAKYDSIVKEEFIVDQIMNLFFAGFDTVASAFTWTLALLSKEKEWKNKLLHKMENSSAADLNEFVTAIVDESMRLYPPVWSFTRVAKEDDQYEDIKINKKSYLIFPQYTIHRNEDFWNEPEEFNPDRFMQKEFDKQNPVYLPFGYGKQMCIGNRSAYMQLQLLIPEVINNFEIELLNYNLPKIKPGIIINPKEPILVKISSRK
ncbi:MAG: cytochrome P450 [Melioribacteraceae bacterium]|nr:cytochrome P450 [Melioribacteraceae bacterium]